MPSHSPSRCPSGPAATPPRLHAGRLLSAVLLGLIAVGCNVEPDRLGTFGPETGGAGETDVRTDSGPEGPRLEAPERISLGRTPVDGESTATFELANAGGAPLEIVATIEETGADDQLELEPRSGWPDTIDLAPGETRELGLRYEPRNEKEDDGRVLLRTDDPTLEDGVARIPIETTAVGRPDFRTRDRLVLRAPSADESVTEQLRLENRGDGPLTFTDVTLEDSERGAFSADTDTLTGSTLPAGESRDFEVRFEPDTSGEQRGELSIETNDPYARENTVDLVGEVQRPCPTAVARADVPGSDRPTTDATVAPGTEVELSGADSTAPLGGITEYQWSVPQLPRGALENPLEDADAAETSITPVVAGRYRVDLTVVGADGRTESCRAASVLVRAKPSADVYVELTWDSPRDGDQTDDDGTDLDLHYLNPKGTWNEAPWDIFWENRTADWGTEGEQSDDPEMAIDDKNGAGPEVVRHPNPVQGRSYAVGVHFFDSNGFGTTYATVRLFSEGKLVKEFSRRRFDKDNQFWYLGRLRWPSKTFVVRDELTSGFPDRP